MKRPAHKVADYVAGFTADDAPHFILVYGPDEGGVAETAAELARRFLGDSADPLQRVEPSDLSDPARLHDEAAERPMFGDRKLIRVRGDVPPAALDLYLKAAPAVPTLLLVETSGLRPTSPLRKSAENDDRAMALPCYEVDAREAAQIARRHLEGEGFRIESAALDTLVARLATDRGVLRRALECLVLYKGPGDTGLITYDDVEAALGDRSAASFDRLVDMVAGGRVAEADRAYAQLAADGRPASVALSALRRHFQTLHRALEAEATGASSQQALQSFRPPLHFKRRAAVSRQLQLWSPRKALQALRLLQTAEHDCRLGGSVEDAIVGQTLLRLARAVSADGV